MELILGLLFWGVVIYFGYQYLNSPERKVKKEKEKAEFDRQERDIEKMGVLEKEQLAAARGYANKPSMASLFIPVFGWFHYFNGRKAQTKIERKRLGLK